MKKAQGDGNRDELWAHPLPLAQVSLPSSACLSTLLLIRLANAYATSFVHFWMALTRIFVLFMFIAAVVARRQSVWDPIIRLPTEENATRWAVLVAGSNGFGNYRHQVYFFAKLILLLNLSIHFFSYFLFIRYKKYIKMFCMS